MKMSTVTISYETPCLAVISGFIPRWNQDGGVGDLDMWTVTILLDTRFYYYSIS